MSYAQVQDINLLKKLSKIYKLYKFKDVIKDSSSKASKIKKQNLKNDGDIPVIDQGKKFIMGYTSNVEKLYTNIPSIVFGDHTRIFKYVDFSFCLGADGTKLLEINKELAYPKYIYYFLHTLNIPSDGYSRHFKYLKDIQIPLPPMEIQIKIANALDKAQELIDNRKAQIEKYDELLQSVFMDMFGDPVTNPKGWEIKRLKDISTKILSGNTPKGGSSVYVDTGIAFFRSQNVWRNNIKYNDIVYIDKATHNKMKNSSLKDKDILMTKTGRFNTENSSLGRAAMFRGIDNSANVNGHVYLIRLNDNNVNKFVLFILTTNKYREYIRSICVGGIDKRQINKSHLENFPIIFPPLQLQSQFASIIENVEIEKKRCEESLKGMEENFNSIMQKAFRGEMF